MLNLDKTVNPIKLPTMFMGFLTAFVAALVIVNLSSIQEKLGFETKTTALIKLESANKEIENLLAINQKLVKELELKNKIQLVTTGIIDDLAKENLSNKQKLDKIDTDKVVALQQLEQEVYIDDYLEEPKSIYTLPVEKPTNTENVNKDNAPVKNVTKKKNKEQIKSSVDKRSEIQIAALWNTYETLRRN